MKKHMYRTTDVRVADWAMIGKQTHEQHIVFGVDIAKEDMVGVLMRQDRSVIVTLKWQHPQESKALIEQLATKLELASLEVVQEPSGTYGDALRLLFQKAGLPVFRVSPKRTNDAKEVYDGVPSLHDAKSAYIIGRLHLDGASGLWEELPGQRRELNALLGVLDMHQKHFEHNRNRLAALLSRHWPEVTSLLEPASVTLLALLTAYGEPRQIAANKEQAGKLMRRIGRIGLSQKKLKQVLASAGSTIGVPCMDAELYWLRELAQEARRGQVAVGKAKKVIEAMVSSDPTMKNMGLVLGKTSAAVLVAKQGSPLEYPSTGSYLKSLGLNLKEKSSGKYQGQLKISKRGPSMSRKYLYFAALRLFQREPIVNAWYQDKVRRDGGKKSKAVTALMRKLAKSIWHVARGETFDAAKLFNVQTLRLTV
ncbi:MAG: transposase [Sedimenticola sp.]